MFTNPNKIKNHSFFMRLALLQAKKNLGNTKENPSVGCVIAKNNHLISAGHTGINGRPHAEVNAINLSKLNLKHSTIYITLEPCSNFGLTPPCVNKIIKSNIKKVVFSMHDPDLRSFKKSKNKFKEKGITVINNILSSEIINFYKSYTISKKKDLPFTTCKLAISNDYYMVKKGNNQITNYFSKMRVHLMRSTHDCMITSSETVIKDNPKLNCRISGLEKTSPVRIILDKNLITPIKSNIIVDAKKYKTIFFYNKINKKKISILRKLNVKLYNIKLNNENDLDLKKVLEKAKELGFSRVFIEAGKKLSINFLKNNLVNELHVFKSNKNVNKSGTKNIKSFLVKFVNKKKEIHQNVNLFGDLLTSYIIK